MSSLYNPLHIDVPVGSSDTAIVFFSEAAILQGKEVTELTRVTEAL